MTDAVMSAVILVAGIGLVAGLLLAIASSVFAVKVNEKETAVRDCLPGANCGACGYSGCDSYAKALAGDSTIPCNLCRPGGNEAAKNIAAVLGVEAVESEPVAAFVHCGGDCSKCSSKSETQTISSCRAAKGLYGGKKSCIFGCLGCGDCQKACAYDAICIENGIAHIDIRKCVGCGMCAKACPNGLISLVPKKEVPVISCSNKEKGAVTRKECSVGCIGCMKCQKNCPAEAITVVDNVATIDYSKCVACGKCVEGCPVGCLTMRKI